MLLGGFRVLEYQLSSRRTPLIGPPLPVLRFTLLRTPATRNHFPNTLPPIFHRVKSPHKADKPLVISLSPPRPTNIAPWGNFTSVAVQIVPTSNIRILLSPSSR